METRGCAERGGEIRGRSVIKFAIIDMSWEEEGERGVSPQRALHASLMVLTEMLYNLCVTGASQSVFMVPHMWKARLISGEATVGCEEQNATIQPVIIKKERA